MSAIRFPALLLLVLATWAIPLRAGADESISLQDAIVTPDGKTRLVAYLSREGFFGIPKDIKHTPVSFFAGGRELGTANSGEEGMAVLDCTLPGADVKEVVARATYRGKVMEDTARVFRWRTDRVIIVIDIDDTISNTDLDDVLFDEEDDDSKPLRHSREALRALSEDYEILYLTARPSFLLGKTRLWLKDREFPAAPVIVSHRKRDLLQQAQYKHRMLADLQKRWPNILIGIGDKATDSTAYGESGLLTLIVRGKKQEKYGRHAILLPDWKTIGRFFKNNRPVLVSPELCRLAVIGKQPLLHVVNRYGDDDDDDDDD